MPTTASLTFSGKKLEPFYNAEDAQAQAGTIGANATVARGTVMGEVTATPGLFKAYLTGAGDGSNVPKCIAVFDMKSDANGKITLGDQTPGELGEGMQSAPFWFSGFFNTAELVGLDAGALSAANWNLVSGSLTAGVLRIG